jgi:membrane protein
MARSTSLAALLRESFSEWSVDKAPRLGAALAYYTVFSLAPLLLVSIALASFVFGAEAARGQIVAQIAGLVGDDGARAVQDMLAAQAQKPRTGALATVVGIVMLLFGAAGVFGQLQDALNTVWEVKPRPGRGIRGFIEDRFLSVTMVLGTGFLLLVSLLLSAGLSAAGGALKTISPGLEAVAHVVDATVSGIAPIRPRKFT